MARLLSVGDVVAGEGVSKVEVHSSGRLVAHVGSSVIMLPVTSRLVDGSIEMSEDQYVTTEQMVRRWAEKAAA